MTSRENILAGVKANQPALSVLPPLEQFFNDDAPNVEAYINTIQAIGGRLFEVPNQAAIPALIFREFDTAKRIISAVPSVNISTEQNWETIDPHLLETVDLALIKAQFGVAENGAIWVTEEDVVVRVLPFICENLAAILYKKDIVNTMHAAYQRIGNASYGFGGFIAGPSKTADIEQSLVLGAHGPKTMTIFLVDNL